MTHNPALTVDGRLNVAIRSGLVTVTRSGLFGVYGCRAANGAEWEQIKGRPLGPGPCSESWVNYHVKDRDGQLSIFGESQYFESLEAFEATM